MISGKIVFTQRKRIFRDSPRFTWTAPTTMTFRCSLDGGTYRSCGRGLTGTWTGNNVPDGQHSLKIRATDPSGNVVEAEISGWIVDTVSPTITFSDDPAKTSGSPMITWRSSEQAEFECSLDGGRYEKCGSGMNGVWSKDNVGDGRHTLSVRGIDSAGNSGTPARHNWDVGMFLMICFDVLDDFRSTNLSKSD
jgi:hypothetical protein